METEGRSPKPTGRADPVRAERRSPKKPGRGEAGARGDGLRAGRDGQGERGAGYGLVKVTDTEVKPRRVKRLSSIFWVLAWARWSSPLLLAASVMRCWASW